jgi:hypothetical protein
MVVLVQVSYTYIIINYYCVKDKKHYLEHSVGGLTPRRLGLNNKKYLVLHMISDILNTSLRFGTLLRGEAQFWRLICVTSMLRRVAGVRLTFPLVMVVRGTIWGDGMWVAMTVLRSVKTLRKRLSQRTRAKALTPSGVFFLSLSI